MVFSEGLLIEKIVAPHGVIDGKENLSVTFIWLTLVSTENEDEDDFEAAFTKEVEGIKAKSEKKERDFQQVGCHWFLIHASSDSCCHDLPLLNGLPLLSSPRP